MPSSGESFNIDRAGALVRSVTPRRGDPHEHRCSAETLETVAHAIDEAGTRGFTLEEIVAAEDLPSTRSAAAIACPKERSRVVTEGRRSYAAGPGVYEDAMIVYYAPAESGDRAST